MHLVNSRPTLSGREHSCARLLGTASAPWIDTPEHQIGSVREAGMTCGAVFAAASADVRRFGDAIRDGINSVTIKAVPPIPPFTDVQWGRARADGAQFITAHRDPARAGGLLPSRPCSARPAFGSGTTAPIRAKAPRSYRRPPGRRAMATWSSSPVMAGRNPTTDAPYMKSHPRTGVSESQ